MRAKARTTKRSQRTAEAAEEVADDVTLALPPTSTNPPLVFILPKDRSPDARIVYLPDPATGVSSRYFLDASRGVSEFRRIAAPAAQPTSWLLAGANEATAGEAAIDRPKADLSTGYTIEDSSLFVATPMDPMFFLIPLLLKEATNGARALYMSLDDYLDKLQESAPALADLLANDENVALLDKRMKSICDAVEAGENSMFRLNIDKLASDLLSKAKAVVSQGLPKSMEQKLVQEVLEPPTMNVPSIPSFATESSATSTSDGNLGKDSPLRDASQVSLSTTETDSALDSQKSFLSTVSTTATSVVTATGSGAEDGEMYFLLCVRTAFDFILASYISRAHIPIVRAAVSRLQGDVDFAPLDKHLEHLSALRQQALGLRSISNSIGRKRPVDEEVEAVRAEKRRKQEEEEAKKKSQSQAMKALAKVNTAGMKKMSSFFQKAPPKKAAT